MGIVFDVSRDPLYLQVFAGRFPYAEVEAHFDELEAYCTSKVRLQPNWRPSLMADARFARGFDARARRRVALSFERLAPVLGPRMVAHCMVAHGKIAQGVLTAMLWLQRPAWPLQVFSDPEEAYRWIIRRHHQEGLPPPTHDPGWWEASGAAARPSLVPGRRPPTRR
jgi:hypothetical protein